MGAKTLTAVGFATRDAIQNLKGKRYGFREKSALSERYYSGVAPQGFGPKPAKNKNGTFV